MSNYYQNHQQPYYDYETQHQSYQQQHSNNYQHDSYAMHDMTQPTANYYPQYDAKPQLATDDGYYPNEAAATNKSQRYAQVATEFSNNEKYSRVHNKHRRSCCDMLCCGCCTCCPRWCRWITCILFLLIIAIAIVVGVLAALFKVPSVEFTGVKGDPAFALSGTTANLNVSLGFTVNNPNIESVTFKTLVATANYHGDTTQLGGGTLNDLHIGSHSVTNISFPFTISMNLLSNDTQAVVAKLMTDCGIDGSAPKDIKLDYKVVATVSIIGIPISVPYSSSVSFACPLDGQSSAALKEIAALLSGMSSVGANLSDLPGTASSIINALPTGATAAIPSDVAKLIPSEYASALAGLAG